MTRKTKAARAYDPAALKYWGPTTTTNFPASNYEREIEEMKHIARQEFVASLWRHHQHGRWQARIGRVAGNKDLYLSTFTTQEEAVEFYDIAAIKFRGLNAVTNFDMSRYDVKSIMSCNLPIGGMSGKSKNSLESMTSNNNRSVDWGGGWSGDHDYLSSASSLSYLSQFHKQAHSPTVPTLSSIPIKVHPSDCWPMFPGLNGRNESFASACIPYDHHQSNSLDFNSGVEYRQQQQQQQEGEVAQLLYATAKRLKGAIERGVSR